MQVRYIGWPKGESDAWLTEGQIYIVLSIFSNEYGIQYRIMAGNVPIPALHPAYLFKVVNNYISSSWVINVGDDGSFLEMGPQAWQDPGFWENYFDDDPDAIKIFEKESYALCIDALK